MPGGDQPSFERSVLIYSKDQVCVHPSDDRSERICGKLTLEKLSQNAILLEWKPAQLQTHGRQAQHMKPPYAQSMSSASSSAPPAGDEFVMVSRGLFRRHADQSATGSSNGTRATAPAPQQSVPAPTPAAPRSHSSAELYAVRVMVSDIQSFRKFIPPPLGGFPQLIIKTKSGLAYPPLYFHDSGLKDFFNAMKEHVTVARSPDDPNEIEVLCEDGDLQGTGGEGAGGVRVGPRVGLSPGAFRDLVAMQRALSVGATPGSPPAAGNPVEKLVWSGLRELSKVTRLARHGAHQLAGGLRGLQQSMEGAARRAVSPQPPAQRGVEDGEGAGRPAAAAHGDDFVLIEDASTPLFGLRRPRGPELSPEEWTTLVDEEGRVRDAGRVRARIASGGLSEELRPLVWRFLLGLYPWDSSYADRERIDAQKRAEYEAVKQQWASITGAQEARFAKFRERRSRIEKDVVRTDRELEFYAGPDDQNANLAALHCILLTYAFYNFDLGALAPPAPPAPPAAPAEGRGGPRLLPGDERHGGADPLRRARRGPRLLVLLRASHSSSSSPRPAPAPLLTCAAGRAGRLLDGRGMASNFTKDQAAMQAQLLELSSIVRTVDPALHEHLSMNGCGNFFFAFRWVLIIFKREFEMHQVLRLWEMAWSSELPRLPLYLAAALIVQARERIVKGRMEFDEVLKFANSLAGQLDVDECITAAEAMQRRHAALLEGAHPRAPSPTPPAPSPAPAAPAPAIPAPSTGPATAGPTSPPHDSSLAPACPSAAPAASGSLSSSASGTAAPDQHPQT
eukprot:tig00000718_g3713.t1